jgi:hypothetical protein
VLLLNDQALEQENEELRDLSLRQTWDISGALRGQMGGASQFKSNQV